MNNYISKTKFIFENFIREFKDMVDWKEISRRQKTSNEFIKNCK